FNTGRIFMLKQILVAATMAAVLSGCASTAVKGAITSIRDSEVAYGAVLDVKPGNTEQNQKNCAKNTNAKWEKVCANLSAYNEAKVAFLNSSRFVTGTYALPANWAVSTGSIVKLSPRNDSVALALVAKEPRPGCEWTGFSLSDLTSR